MLKQDVGLNSSFQLNFPGVTLTQPIAATRARLIQAPMSHDILVLSARIVDGMEVLLNGAPVTFSWTRDQCSGLFCGYVHRVDGHFGVQENKGTIYCIGVSYPLMQRGVDVWVGVRASDVVRSVASKFRLACDVEDHPRLYPHVMQAGESYWKLLTRLALETGYVLKIENATIVFRSRDSMISHYRPIAPSVQPQEFVPKVGAFTPELGVSRETRTSYGVHSSSGDVLSYSESLDSMAESSSTAYQGVLTSAVVNSQVEATTATQAAQEANRFTILAKMTCPGNAYLAPERIIYVPNANSSLEGYWTVRSVEHDLTLSTYKCTAEVGSDGLGQTIARTGESTTGPVPSSVLAEVNPHRPGAFSWPYPNPVLTSNNSVEGTMGVAVSDYAWVAQVVTERN